ncbi:MAG TPA: hypothetical protein VJV74_07870 [Terriglobia bacterium]|nr:hypothetical protein [Terriglobia bacterium]
MRERPAALHPAASDIRFLEYRLDVISRWPASARKCATAEAISRRLAAIGRASLCRQDVDNLMAASCRLLDNLFSDNSAADPTRHGSERIDEPPVQPA